jgi:hypothetical protein
MATTAFPFSHEQQYEWRQHNAMAVASQQQHFNRMAALSNASATSAAMTASEQQVTLLNSDSNLAEDNRRTVEWISQLLNPATREQSLLELSKKREQVPELALVLWHSFGKSFVGHSVGNQLIGTRSHDCTSAGNHFRVSSSEPIAADGSGFQPCVQCLGSAPVRGVAQ